MTHDWPLLIIAVLGALVAGVINTLAGSGSAVTLTVLVSLGLPAPIANGTNRVGIVVQALVSVLTLRKGGALKVDPAARWLVGATMIGALGGAWLAADLDAATMNAVIALIMTVLLASVLLNPKRWLQDQGVTSPARPGPGQLAGFVAIGFYGGFIQAGVGILMLAGLVLGAGRALVPANAIKNFIALCFTVPALLVFVLHDQVDWAIGGLMAVGQATGAWLAARFALENDQAKIWVRRLLIVVLIGAIARFSGALGWLWKQVGG